MISNCMKAFKFHDGSDFDADDVVFSLDRARGENSVNAQKALFEPIEAVVAKDKYTVEMTPQAPNRSDAVQSGLGRCRGWLRQKVPRTNKSNPVGTGPFKLNKWVKGDSISLVKKWRTIGARQPSWTKPHSRSFADAAAALAALMAGDVGRLPDLPGSGNAAAVRE